jgi:CxxC motif-containing protein (DUF1111 family)
VQRTRRRHHACHRRFVEETVGLRNFAGCVLCHSPSLTTGASGYTGMGGVISRPYSDFALYHLGVGQRLFFMHDGRTADLLQAILDHQSDHGSEHGAGLR